MDTGYKVSDIMTINPICISESESVKSAAESMKSNKVGSLLVMSGSNLKGIITERDLVVKVVCFGKDPNKLLVKEVMTLTKDIITIDPGRDIYSAMMIMKENEVRRLPVMSKGKVVGLITAKDILKIQPELFDLVVESYEIKEQERKFQILD